MPRNHCYSTKGIFLVVCLLWGLSSPSVGARDKECWELHQRSDLWGDQFCYISNSAVYFRSPKLGIKLFMQAPDWKVFGINDRTKTYIEMDNVAWRRDVFGETEHPVMKRTKSVTGEIAGLHAQEYLVEDSYRPGLKANVPEQTKDGKKWNTAVWVAPSIKLSRQVLEIVAKPLDVPIDAGLPLRAVQFGADGTRVVTVDTSSCKKVPFPSELFFVPKDYRRALNELVLLFGGKNDVGTYEPAEPSTVDVAAGAPAMQGWVPGDDTSSGSAKKTKTTTHSATQERFWIPGL